MKFVKESTETLVKQKQFLVEDLDKSRIMLMNESVSVEQHMLSENSNKDYLISVKKAVKQS